MLFKRHALQPPLLDSLCGRVRVELREASAILPALRPVPTDAILSAPAKQVEHLGDPLSLACVELNGSPRTEIRSVDEERVLGQFGSGSIGAGLERPPTTVSMITALHQQVTSGTATARTGNIYMRPDAAGHCIQLPPVGSVQSQLERLGNLGTSHAAAPPLFVATLSLALVVNCHPFTDGNGRVGRILFNAILREAGMPSDVYIPFYEIALRSRGGYEIALRRAEIRGEWDPLFSYAVSVIWLCRDLSDNERAEPTPDAATADAARAR